MKEKRTRKAITQDDRDLMKTLEARGMDHAAIASLIGCSVAAVKDNLDPDYDAKKAIKLEKYHRRKEQAALKEMAGNPEEIREEAPQPVQMKMDGFGGLPEGWIATELEGLRREVKQLREELSLYHKAQTDWETELRKFLSGCWRGLMGLFKALRGEEDSDDGKA